MPSIWLFIFAISFLVSFTLTTLLIGLAPKLKFYDMPGERKIHHKPVPYGGGVAVFLTIYIFFILAWLGVKWLPIYQWLPELVAHQKGLESLTVNKQVGGILLGGIFIFATGLVDDIKPLGPKIKLLMCLVASIILIATGTQITAFSVLCKGTFLGSIIDANIINILVTILWVTGITNAFNLLDNMDGLCAGVALIIAGILLILSIESGELFVAAFIVLFIGAVGGFWVYNYNPARIFLGDSGSLLIGYLLSIVTILPTYYHSKQEGSHLISVFLPLIILAIPIYDTLSVMVIRYRLGKPFFQGDRNHFSHRLESLGLSRQQAVLVIYLVCLCSGLAALMLNKVDTFGSVLLFVQVLMLFLVVLILENAGRKNKKVDP